MGDRAYELSLYANTAFNSVRGLLGLPYWSLSLYLKHRVKVAVGFVSRFEERIAATVHELEVDGLVCGHIHRAEMRTQRAAIYDDDQAAAAMAVLTRLARMAIVRNAHTVAGYSAVRGEVDIGAALASGSYRTAGMTIVPCSIKTLADLATCHADTLIARAGDVTLKEGRPLGNTGGKEVPSVRSGGQLMKRIAELPVLMTTLREEESVFANHNYRKV